MAWVALGLLTIKSSVVSRRYHSSWSLNPRIKKIRWQKGPGLGPRRPRRNVSRDADFVATASAIGLVQRATMVAFLAQQEIKPYLKRSNDNILS